MPRATNAEALFVAKANKARLDMLAAGERLAAQTGYSIAALRLKVVRDRLRFARRVLRAAEAATKNPTADYRTAVSRAYYSMYHAFRSVSYYCNGGDDYEDHQKLPGSIPDSFPNKNNWENDLKAARLERNRADYDPYPADDKQFRASASDLIAKARLLMPTVRSFLIQHGCAL